MMSVRCLTVRLIRALCTHITRHRNAKLRCACQTAAATGPLLHTYSALKSHGRKSFINNRPNPIEKRIGSIKRQVFFKATIY